MDATAALAREESWREHPQVRPRPDTAKAVAAALASRVRQLERQMNAMQRLLVGRRVLIERGNPGRGPETGPGFGRRVSAVIEEVPVGDWEVRCRLLVDDPDAVGAPCRAGDSGFWSVSQIIVE